MPFTAFTVVVPSSVPAPEAIIAVTAVRANVTGTPEASSSWTAGCVVRGTPFAAPAGCVRIAICDGVVQRVVFALAICLTSASVSSRL